MSFSLQKSTKSNSWRRRECTYMCAFKLCLPPLSMKKKGLSGGYIPCYFVIDVLERNEWDKVVCLPNCINMANKRENDMKNIKLHCQTHNFYHHHYIIFNFFPFCFPCLIKNTCHAQACWANSRKFREEAKQQWTRFAYILGKSR